MIYLHQGTIYMMQKNSLFILLILISVCVLLVCIKLKLFVWLEITEVYLIRSNCLWA